MDCVRQPSLTGGAAPGSTLMSQDPAQCAEVIRAISRRAFAPQSEVTRAVVLGGQSILRGGAPHLEPLLAP